MKKHIRKYYEQLYQGKKGVRVRGLAGKSLAVELGYPAGLIDPFLMRYGKIFCHAETYCPISIQSRETGCLTLAAGPG